MSQQELTSQENTILDLLYNGVLIERKKTPPLFNEYVIPKNDYTTTYDTAAIIELSSINLFPYRVYVIDSKYIDNLLKHKLIEIYYSGNGVGDNLVNKIMIRLSPTPS